MELCKILILLVTIYLLPLVSNTFRHNLFILFIYYIYPRDKYNKYLPSRWPLARARQQKKIKNDPFGSGS